MDQRPLILLTGATGYVGGRLLKALEDSGRRLRCLVRRPEFLQSRIDPDTELVAGDCLYRPSLKSVMCGIHTAYYLVHSTDSARVRQKWELRAARNFAEAAKDGGVQRIIYLGSLGDSDGVVLTHLQSRQAVGDILRSFNTPVIEFRTSIVIGSGSLSFEMIRASAERLPVMICPRWLSVPAQPIAIEDLIAYLVAALNLPVERSRILEIGGPDTVSYLDIMREYARQRGLHRIMIPVPFLMPRLSSLWLALVTPLYPRVGRMLIENMRNPSIVRDKSALEVLSNHPRTVREAVERARSNEDQKFAETRWSDALSSAGVQTGWVGACFGTRILDSRLVSVDVSADTAFKVIRRIGGETGWYYGNWLWRLRGLLDALVGGVGLRRGRRHPEDLSVADTIDFWRVEVLEEGRKLVLAAEMKLPGRAWLAFEVQGMSKTCVVRQTAIFDPVGLWGLTYWYLLYPVHRLVFRGMLRGIADECRREIARSSKTD